MSRYPIVEIFASLQGEGFYTGIPMTFVRFAGCNVGRALNTAGFPIIQPPAAGYTVCESVFGTKFGCDTNYHPVTSMSLDALVQTILITGEMVGVRRHRICFTGGEPFLQDLRPLMVELTKRGTIEFFHFETSGTHVIPRSIYDDWDTWIACSPKKATRPENLPIINEHRFLVSSAQGTAQYFADRIHDYLEPLQARPTSRERAFYVGGINDVGTLVHDETAFALEVARLATTSGYPFRVNVQMHKLLNMR